MDAVLHRVSSPTFVGRADELAALDGALGRAAAGVPAFTFVAGESGVGKSRLVAELEARARNAGARVFVGHCLELGGAAIPYAPLVDALRPIARELVECGSDVADGLPPASRAALAELMPEFRAPDAAADGDSAQQARVFEALLALIERLGRVAAGRARARGPALGRPVDARLPHLPRAQRARRAALARRHLPLRRAAPPPPAAAAAGRARAHARRRPARAGALQPRRAGRADLRDPRRAGARRSRRPPVRAQRGQPALHRGAAGRLRRRLPGAARDAARPARRARGAAAGDRAGGRARRSRSSTRCATALLAALSDLDEAELLRGLREAVAHQVLVAGSGETYAFRHALVGEAVYGDLLPGERSALHARLAETVDERRELMGDAPAAAVAGDPRLPLERRARRPARARRLRRGRRWRPSACSPSARPSATSSARWSCGTACPTPRSARAATAPTCCAHAAAAAANAGRGARARSRWRARRSREVDAAGRPAAGRVPATSGSGTTCAGPARPRTGFAAYEQAMELLPDGDSPQRARLLEYRARGLMLRGRFEDGAEGARGGARDGRALRRRRRPRPARSTRSGCRAPRSATVEEGIALLRRSRDLARRAARQVEHVQAITNLSERARPRGPHRGGAGRDRGRDGGAAREPRAHVLRHVHGAAGREPHDQARPAGASSRPGCRRRSSATPSARRRSSSRELRARLALLAGDARDGAAPARGVPPPVPGHAATRSGWSRCTRWRRSSRCSRTARRTRATRSAAGSRLARAVPGGHADRAAARGSA